MLDKLKTASERLAADERGATAVEYALIAGLFAIMIIGFTGTMNGAWARVYGKISAAMPQ